MTKGTTYVWAPQEYVHILDFGLQVEDFALLGLMKFLYCPLVWTGDGYNTHYGHFAQTERFQIYWEETGSQTFPPEFKASLLLMGVTL